MTAKRSQPPAVDELEVSVFGPGRGECIVVHVPGGTWFVVDSHRVQGQSKKAPVGLVYLRDELKVASLDGVFITHWHKDHTDGIADLLRAYAHRLRIVGLPPAFGSRELASLVADLVPAFVPPRPVEDLCAAMAALKEPGLDRVQTVVLQNGVRLEPHGSLWTLTVLSPSFHDVRAQLASLQALLARKRKVQQWDPNSGSAVLRLEVGGRVVMLCSDLDVGKTTQRGWQHIVQHHAALLPSQIVKVGHHGSETAYYPQAWAIMGRADGVLTPFPARGTPHPRDDMLKKLRKHVARLFVTAGVKSSNRAGKVLTNNTPFVGYHRTSPLPLANVGQVRFRWAPAEVLPRVELFSTARRI